MRYDALPQCCNAVVVAEWKEKGTTHFLVQIASAALQHMLILIIEFRTVTHDTHTCLWIGWLSLSIFLRIFVLFCSHALFLSESKSIIGWLPSQLAVSFDIQLCDVTTPLVTLNKFRCGARQGCQCVCQKLLILCVACRCVFSCKHTRLGRSFDS